jgi:AcrR family transcriptional regulator
MKKPSIRRREILDAAASLFHTQGYQNTSVENIIHKANIAKGTFYYHFDSKQLLLDAIADNISHELYGCIKKITQATDLDTMEKLGEIFNGEEKKQIMNRSIMDALHQPENRELQEKLNIRYIEDIIPLITDVFNQGTHEKLWKRKVSVSQMQTLLGGVQFILDSGLFDWDNIQRQTYLQECISLLEHILGAKPGIFSTLFYNTKQ